MSEMSEADLTAEGVDTRLWEASEDDEEAVLRALYGPPDAGGVYRGEGAS
ncbi:hypothetical protein ACFWYW_55930 [Nonomuraea sp. NPDC059023]